MELRRRLENRACHLCPGWKHKHEWLGLWLPFHLSLHFQAMSLKGTGLLMIGVCGSHYPFGMGWAVHFTQFCRIYPRSASASVKGVSPWESERAVTGLQGLLGKVQPERWGSPDTIDSSRCLSNGYLLANPHKEVKSRTTTDLELFLSSAKTSQFCRKPHMSCLIQRIDLSMESEGREGNWNLPDNDPSSSIFVVVVLFWRNRHRNWSGGRHLYISDANWTQLGMPFGEQFMCKVELRSWSHHAKTQS